MMVEMFLCKNFVGPLEPFPQPVLERCVEATGGISIQPMVDNDLPGFILAAVTAVGQLDRDVWDDESLGR